MKCDEICEWVGTVGTFKEHLATCEFTLLPCPKECKDDNNKVKAFMRKDLDKHLKDCPNRSCTCEYCGEKGTYANITAVHDKTCEKKIVPCSNTECPKTMQCQLLGKHVNTECEYTEIPCKYKKLGCGMELKRKDMAAHEQDDSLHLHMAIDKVNSLEEEKVTVKFKLQDYQKNKVNDKEIDSYICPRGYHMSLGVHPNGNDDAKGTHVSVYASIKNGKYDRELKWPLLADVTFTLLNQLEDTNHYRKTMKFTPKEKAQVGSEWGISDFISHSKLDYDPNSNTQYLKDDTLYFVMSVRVAGLQPLVGL